ncbi:MAG: hypothetical protein GY754_19510 [bacterium]|nr:hypothetical protein [bacterium]
MKKRIGFILLVLFLAVFAMGCEEGLRNSDDSASNDTEDSQPDFSFSEMYKAISDLQTEMIALKARVSTLESSVNSGYASSISQLQTDLGAVEVILSGVTRVGDDLTFSGMNVHIESGSGSTSGAVNGLGNLMIGYNELRGSGDDRSGSHNLVIGSCNNFTQYGGIVSGYYNATNGAYSNVTGGRSNIASGYASSVAGGASNAASGDSSTVSGGNANSATNNYTSVTGGKSNTAVGDTASISAGNNVTVSSYSGWAAGTYIYNVP